MSLVTISSWKMFNASAICHIKYHNHMENLTKNKKKHKFYSVNIRICDGKNN